MRADALRIGSHTFSSRLIVGTGKYASYEVMREALDISGTECITVAVRRERLIDAAGKNLLDFIDTRRYTILPNTAGCFTAEDAVRVARLGREILAQLGNPGADWVKLEVLGDKQDAAARPDRHARGHQDAGGRGLSGAGLHQRRSGDGPAAEGGRGRQRHARRKPHRLRPGRVESQRHPHLPGIPEGKRSRTIR